MTEQTSDIKEAVKAYILQEFLPGENPEALEDSTPMITGGILDSIATVKLATFLEQEYGIELQAHEMSPDYLDSISDIINMVQSKISEK